MRSIMVFSVLAVLWCLQALAVRQAEPVLPIYLGFALGMESIADSEHQTAAMRWLSAGNTTDFAERLIVGYRLNPFFAWEAGLNLLVGYNYQVQPYENTVHRDLGALDFLAKWIYSVHGFESFIAAGCAVVYSNVDNFSMIFAVDGEEEGLHAVEWGSHYFIRPTLAAGISYHFLPQMSMGLMASYIFSQGDFSSSLETVNEEPVLVIDPNSLPAMTFVGVTFAVTL